MRRMIIIIVVVVAIVAAGVFVLNQVAKSHLYKPNQDTVAYDIVNADSRMEQVRVDGKYDGWFVHMVDGRAPLVIFFYGNAQCAAGTVRALNDTGYLDMLGGANLLVVDYPGYGTNTGGPSQSAIFAMARSVYDYAKGRPDVDPAKIIAEGYSLGTGVATYIASQRPVVGLMLVAPYDSGVSLYNSVVDIFHGPLKLLVLQRFDSASYAKQVHVRPIIVASTADQTVNYKLSQALAPYFPKTADFHLFDGLRHVDYYRNAEVRRLLEEYAQTSLA